MSDDTKKGYVQPTGSALDKVDTNETINEDTLAEIPAGDISSLDSSQRTQFLWRLAKGLGLNPLTKPFDLIVLNNKLTVYANRTASDQLRKKHGISSTLLYEGYLKLSDDKYDESVYCVKLMLKDSTGREEFSMGCVGIANYTGESLGNQIMKCHTKALRRGAIAMCGLGFLDEIEVASISEVAKATGRPGPTRVMPPPEASAATPSRNGPAVVVLPPTKPPVTA